MLFLLGMSCQGSVLWQELQPLPLYEMMRWTLGDLSAAMTDFSHLSPLSDRKKFFLCARFFYLD